MKISENLQFSDVFKGYGSGALAENELNLTIKKRVCSI